MKKILMAMVVSATVFMSMADSKPEGERQQELAAALVPKVQTSNADFDITLARFSLVAGRHQNVYGLDFGILGNFTTEDMMGFAVSGLFNHVGKSSGALQIACIFNYSKGDFAGMQVGIANYALGECIGLQVGAANISGTLYGVQIGVLNKAHDGEGFQLGVINVADMLTGVQIGLININHGAAAHMTPIFNCNF